MRRIATLMVLVLMTSLAVPQSTSQQKKTPAQTQKARPDVPLEMERARQALQNAKSELERAGDEWGGHRTAAFNHVNEALAEIQKAEEFAKQHKLIK